MARVLRPAGIICNRPLSCCLVSLHRWHATSAPALLWRAGAALAYIPAAVAVAATVKRAELLLEQRCAPGEVSRLQSQPDLADAVQAAAAAV